MSVTTLPVGEQAELNLGPVSGPPKITDYLNYYPDFGRPFGSYRLFESGQTSNIQVIHGKVQELYDTYSGLADFEFVEGFNLNGDNAEHFATAIKFRNAYMPYHGVDRSVLTTEQSVEAGTSYEHYKHHLGRLLDGGEQALPTGVFKVNSRQYFNARIDERDYLFIVRGDGTWGQFTGIRMNSEALADEWLTLGEDLKSLTEVATLVVDETAIMVNGAWIRDNGRQLTAVS